MQRSLISVTDEDMGIGRIVAVAAGLLCLTPVHTALAVLQGGLPLVYPRGTVGRGAKTEAFLSPATTLQGNLPAGDCTMEAGSIALLNPDGTGTYDVFVKSLNMFGNNFSADTFHLGFVWDGGGTGKIITTTLWTPPRVPVHAV